MSRKKTSPRPSERCGCGDLHPAPSRSRKGDWFGRFGWSQIPAAMPTPSCLSPLDGFMKPWCSTPFGSEATQAKGWLKVPTMILCVE